MTRLQGKVAKILAHATLVCLLSFNFLCLHTGATQAQSILQNKLIAKAKVDECFYDFGDPRNTPAGFQSPCPTGAIPKVSGAYIWGMTESISTSGKYIWFGTVNNYLCQVIHTLFAATGTPPAPFKTSSYACEFNSSQFPTNAPVSDLKFDWRLPQIYRYKTGTSGPVLATKGNGMLTDAMAVDLSYTQGIRSAGSTDQIVFLGGPSGVAGTMLPGPGLFPSSITLFAFSPSGSPKGSCILPYTDIRKWIFVQGHLYAGVQAPNGTGRLLHWIGTKDNPFNSCTGNKGFEEVGNTDGEIAYLATMGDRIYATTWGGFNGPAVRCATAPNPFCIDPTTTVCGSLQPFPGANNHLCQTGLWVSPPLGDDYKLNPTDLNNWTEIWNIGQYEPDPAIAFSIVGGAVEAYNNQIYWGTMQVPLTGYITHCLALGTQDPNGCGESVTPAGALAALILTTRPTMIFRNNGGTVSPTTESLYGSALLPKYTVTGLTTGTWVLAANNLGGVAPSYGLLGFGNPFNAYTWSGAVYKNRLYFGTFDWSFPAWDGLSTLASALGFDPISGPLSSTNVQMLLSNYPTILPTSDPWWIWPHTSSFIKALLNQNLSLAFGADLWRFDSSSVPAKAESINGLGNPLNYGIRSMVSDTSQLWPGTANAMNLRTKRDQPNGGWEFRALTR